MKLEFPTKRMLPLAHWAPAAICALISMNAISGSIADRTASWWAPVFYSFLPFCFFYVGMVTKSMQNEINDLRSRLDAVNYARNSTEKSVVPC